MTIAIGCDHGGYPLKGEILKYLFKNNYVVVDCGTDSAVASVDYPDYAKKVAEAVKNGEVDRGILLCGTGLGVTIAANKVPGIRCALLSDAYSARMSREHNNCNVMALGARVTGPGLAEELVDIFLKTDFPGDERHQRRIDKITEIEVAYSK